MDHSLTRRGFLRIAGMSGVALLGTREAMSQTPDPAAKPADAAPPAAVSVPVAPRLEPKPIPTRPLGRTGVNIPILSLGGMFDTRSAQLYLRQTLAWGVSAWDTADCYENGNSEEGYGRYFQRNPDDRAKVFLTSKSDELEPKGMANLLQQSLKRLNTTYIDLYLLHGIKTADALTPEVRDWAKSMKAAGSIRHFGFSTHRNMEDLLGNAASLGWIDVVLTSVNYRLLNNRKMLSALDACHKAGVGIIGMKFKGGGPIHPSPEAEERLAAAFVGRGFTLDQAMLKALWEHPAIASVCASMTNFGTMREYVAAAFDRKTLEAGEFDALRRHALETRGSFCQACGACDAATQGAPVADAMRCLMYENAYGDGRRAREAFRSIPQDLRTRLVRNDWSAVQQCCPNGLPLGQLIADAVERFGV